MLNPLRFAMLSFTYTVSNTRRVPDWSVVATNACDEHEMILAATTGS